MIARLRSHLTYANVMATLAVFLVLGGGAYAAFHLPKNSVKSRNIVNREVRPGDLAKNQVIKQVSWRKTEGAPEKTLFSMAGLTVKATCPPGDYVVLDATTTVPNSIIGVSPYQEGVDDVFDAGEHQIIPLDDFVGSVSYGAGPKGKPAVSATFLANKHSATGICSVVGTVVGG